jgi:hypothetical protein
MSPRRPTTDRTGTDTAPTEVRAPRRVRVLAAALALAVVLGVAVVGGTRSTGADADPPVALSAVAPRVAGTVPQPTGVPSRLRVNGDDAPMAVAPADVRLSWVPATGTQSAYRVVVASTEADAAAGQGDVWDSGNVRSASTQGIAYAGSTLAPASRYWFAVRTAGPDGDASPWSEPMTFGTTVADWDAVPVWAPTTGAVWSDYTVSTRLTVDARAMGISFRAADAANGYLWQFRPDNDTLVPFVQHSGRYTAARAVDLRAAGIDLRTGTDVAVSISAVGDRLRTTVDGVLVDDRRDGTFASGWVGVRTGKDERGTLDGLRVTGPTGAALWQATATGSTTSLPCVTQRGERITVAAGRTCVYDPWADYSLSTSFVATTGATGFVFRAQDDRDGYLWQVDTQRSRLLPYVRVRGAYRALTSVPLGADVVAGRKYTIRIDLRGSSIRTTFQGRQIDSRTDRTFRRGLVGFRTGAGETVTARSYAVTDPTGAAVYTAGTHASDFSCATVTTDGALVVPRSSQCLVRSHEPDWTFARRSFTLPAGTISWATMWSTGTSPEPARQYVYRAQVNGAFAAAGPVRSIGSEVRYDSTDVTALVHAGTENVVGLLAHTERDRRLLAQLVVAYDDGRRITIGTDGTWRTLDGTAAIRPGAPVGTGYFTAPSEDIDTAAFPDGWDRPGFDATGWRAPVSRSPFAAGAVQPSPLEPIVQSGHQAVRTVASGNGRLLLDFGRTWMGSVRLDTTTVDDRDVRVEYAETLTAAGTALAVAPGENRQRDHWRLHAGADPVAGWGLRVFRYVELTGLPTGTTAADVTALALHSPVSTGAFASSDDALDEVVQFSAGTLESTALGMYVDSWKRERAPYEADAYIQQIAQAAVDGHSASAEYTTRWLLAHPTWPTEWPLFNALAVHAAWQETGDTREVTANWAALQRTLLTSSIDRRTGLVDHDEHDDIVDWPKTERDGYVRTRVNTVVNVLTYRDLVTMSEMARAIGHTAEARSYAAKATALRAAINERLWDPSVGAYRDGLTADGKPVRHWAVHATAFALAFGVADGTTTPRAGSYLAKRGMACSVYCAAFLVPALFESGQGRAGVSLLTATGERSWRNMIATGAGSTMEAWDTRIKDNTTHSHPWGASPTASVATGLFGLRPTAATWSSFEVAPHPGGLRWASITRPTARGDVAAGFRASGSDVVVTVRVPAASTATVRLPGTDDSGDVWVDGERDAGHDGTVRLGPGCHTVSTAAADGADDGQVPGDVCG